jgi:hypothetical protein
MGFVLYFIFKRRDRRREIIKKRENQLRRDAEICRRTMI